MMRRFKLVEFSETLSGKWEVIFVWSEEEAHQKWKKLREWIVQEQPYGFFRMIKEGYVDE